MKKEVLIKWGEENETKRKKPIKRAKHRVLVLGSKGRLGRALVEQIACFKEQGLDIQVCTYDRKILSKKNFISLNRRIKEFCPTWIFNAIAYTDVDGAEKEENQELNEWSNHLLLGELVHVVKAARCKLLHISTDYVFCGLAPINTEHNQTGPRSCYGKAKRKGELALLHADIPALIVRVGWLHGMGRDFVTSFLTKLLTYDFREPYYPDFSLPENQIGIPSDYQSFAHWLIEAVFGTFGKYVRKGEVLHYSEKGEPINRYEYGQVIVQRALVCLTNMLSHTSKRAKAYKKIESAIDKLTRAEALIHPVIIPKSIRPRISTLGTIYPEKDLPKFTDAYQNVNKTVDNFCKMWIKKS